MWKRSSQRFEIQYCDWLEQALKDGAPPEVVAFTFNLYQKSQSHSLFGIDFVGASTFDLADPDWACEEVWEPKSGRNFDIPLEFSGADWHECLKRVSSFLRTIIDGNSSLSLALRSVLGIGLGFVDGDQEIIYIRPQ